MIFIPSSPGSQLRKRLTERIKQSRLKIEIVERTGRTMKQELQRKQMCEEVGECMVCRTGERGSSRKTGVITK